jgi:hypothetical protein
VTGGSGLVPSMVGFLNTGSVCHADHLKKNNNFFSRRVFIDTVRNKLFLKWELFLRIRKNPEGGKPVSRRTVSVEQGDCLVSVWFVVAVIAEPD